MHDAEIENRRIANRFEYKDERIRDLEAATARAAAATEK